MNDQLAPLKKPYRRQKHTADHASQKVNRNKQTVHKTKKQTRNKLTKSDDFMLMKLNHCTNLLDTARSKNFS